MRSDSFLTSKFKIHQITKQENRSHVIMTTSEYGYQGWMNKGQNSLAWHGS